MLGFNTKWIPETSKFCSGEWLMNAHHLYPSTLLSSVLLPSPPDVVRTLTGGAVPSPSRNTNVVFLLKCLRVFLKWIKNFIKSTISSSRKKNKRVISHASGVTLNCCIKWLGRDLGMDQFGSELFRVFSLTIIHSKKILYFDSSQNS